MPKSQIPSSDQFDKILEDMRGLSQLVDEIDRSMALARGIDRYEVTRALELARWHIEIAQYFVSKSIKYARVEETRI